MISCFLMQGMEEPKKLTVLPTNKKLKNYDNERFTWMTGSKTYLYNQNISNNIKSIPYKTQVNTNTPFPPDREGLQHCLSWRCRPRVWEQRRHLQEFLLLQHCPLPRPWCQKGRQCPMWWVYAACIAHSYTVTGLYLMGSYSCCKLNLFGFM